MAISTLNASHYQLVIPIQAAEKDFAASMRSKWLDLFPSLEGDSKDSGCLLEQYERGKPPDDGWLDHGSTIAERKQVIARSTTKPGLGAATLLVLYLCHQK